MRSEVPSAPEVPAPADLCVCLNESVRVLDAGRTVFGGSPLRLLSLTEDGARVIRGWQKPSPVGEALGSRRLARRLLDAGILTPLPRPARSTAELTFVVPVRDRPAQLERCLHAILGDCPDSPVLVVDDGSAVPVAVPSAFTARRLRVLRRPIAGGPAAARNHGLAACPTPYVAFVDSDVVLAPGSAALMLGHLRDPCVAAVAPRVRAGDGSAGLIGGYESRHSALDMGRAGGPVAPGRTRGWVPSAALLIRREAMGDGFDESMPFGEDVDLVWRLAAAGWRVRYAPEAEVRHDHRTELGAFVARRYLYARSIGALARRHPGMLPAIWVSPPLALPWMLLLSGRRRAALGAAAAAAVYTSHRLRSHAESPYLLSVAIVARGLAATGSALGRAARRAWAPPLLLLAARRSAWRGPLVAAFAVVIVRDAIEAESLRSLVGDIPLRLLDELTASAGTWNGCLRERTLGPLLPSWHGPELALT